MSQLRTSPRSDHRPDATTWPPARRSVVALFDDPRNASAAAGALRVSHPDLEPRVTREPAWTPGAGAEPRVVEVRTTDDRSVARTLAAARAVQVVYRAGAWTNERLLPTAA